MSEGEARKGVLGKPQSFDQSCKQNTSRSDNELPASVDWRTGNHPSIPSRPSSLSYRERERGREGERERELIFAQSERKKPNQNKRKGPTQSERRTKGPNQNAFQTSRSFVTFFCHRVETYFLSFISVIYFCHLFLSFISIIYFCHLFLSFIFVI